MAETMIKVILTACLLVGLGTSASAADVKELYSKSCAVCHAAGAAGAPKTGVKADWQPRLEKGMDNLVKSVENGLNAMPPKGMCFSCSVDDYKALITYMSTPK